MKLLIIEPNGKHRTIEPPRKWFEHLYTELDCQTIELVRGNWDGHDCNIYVDEEGILNLKPLNLTATAIMHNLHEKNPEHRYNDLNKSPVFFILPGLATLCGTVAVEVRP